MPVVLQKILLFCSAWIIVLPLLLGLLYYKKNGKPFSILTLHLLIAFITELSSVILMNLKINNLPLLHVYTITEFILIYLFYSSFWQNSYPRAVMHGIAGAFVLFSVVNSLVIQDVYTFNTYARALEALLLVVFSLLTFYKLFLVQENNDAARGMVWVTAGLLIYFSGAFVLFVLSNYILDMGKTLNTQIWAVHSLLSIQLYILIAAGIWKRRK